MPKPPLVSVVEDDQYFAGPGGKAHEVVGLQPSRLSVDRRFLASPRLVETVCLIADVHMPAMTGSNSTDIHRRRLLDSDYPRYCLPR